MQSAHPQKEAALASGDLLCHECGCVLQVLMPMAHRFGLKRIVTLCELAISKELDRACQQGIARSTLNPMVLLKLARDCDAEQLATFLRHFIGTNIEALQGKPEFRLINPDDLEQIEAHRWPPLWCAAKHMTSSMTCALPPLLRAFKAMLVCVFHVALGMLTST
jgi:hypothetical protein